MADEAQIQQSININNSTTGFKVQSVNTSYKDTVTGSSGPVPGMVIATTAGLSITFTGLTTPGWCELVNLDITNFVEYGIWDGSTFHELGELPPSTAQGGKPQIIKLSRNMTGLRLKADTANCDVQVKAYEV
tara:strand:+ start:33306 stop:33701 length:396 start_codon:yes stop_codon:yes gene_type:complete